MPDEIEEREIDKEVLEAAAPQSDSMIRWQSVLFVLGTLIAMGLVWASSSSWFDIPEDVQKDRAIYALARQQYIDDPHYWYCQWAQVDYTIRQMLSQGREQDLPMTLMQITPQTFMAFLVNRGNAKIEHLQDVATVPRLSGSSFMISISKPEPNAWPFTIMLSVEINMMFESKGPVLKVTRLRKGSQELPPSLAWLYFNVELERLKSLSKEAISTYQSSERKR